MGAEFGGRMDTCICVAESLQCSPETSKTLLISYSESRSVVSDSLCPMDYTVYGFLQARILEGVAFPFSRESSQPRDQTQVSCIASRFFTVWATQGRAEWEDLAKKEKGKRGSSSFSVCSSPIVKSCYATRGISQENRNSVGIFTSLRIQKEGLPRWARGKEPACQCRRHKEYRFDPWVRKISWRRKWQSTPVFLPGESHGQRNLAGYSPWGRKNQTQLSD